MKKIDNIQRYVREQLILSNRIIYKATKVVKVKAVQGKVGEKVQTIMKDGHKETENTVEKDLLTGQPDWIITNPDGERYVIPNAIFRKKYKRVSKNTYVKKNEKIIVLEIKENIYFISPWGKEMYIKKGGFLVISSIRDIYGIQRKEFFSTYKILNIISKEKIINKLITMYYPELCDIEILTTKEQIKRIYLGQKIDANIKDKKYNN